MKNVKISLLCTSLIMSGTATAGWFDFLSSSDEAATVEAVPAKSETAQQIDKVNDALKSAQVASDVQELGLTDALVKQLGVSETQAEGGSGALLEMAKSNMSEADFGELSKSIPGIDSLIGAAPEQKATSSSDNLLGSLANATGNDSLISAAGLADTFQKLDLSSDMVGQFVPVIVDYVKTNGGEGAANLLSSALSGL
mgnify:CR=1 FL=1